MGQMLLDVRSAVFGAAPVEFFGKPGGALITFEDIYDAIMKADKEIAQGGRV